MLSRRPSRACSTASVRSCPAGAGTALWIAADDLAAHPPGSRTRPRSPTSAMSPWTSTSDVTNASERAWLKPSAARSLTNESLSSCTRPVSRSVLRASSPGELPGLGNPGGRAHAPLRRNADLDRGRLDLDLELLDLLAVAAVELVQDLAVELDARPIVAFVTWTNGDVLDVPTAVRAIVRSPLEEAVGGHDAELEQAVVGTSHPRTPRRRRRARRRSRAGRCSPCPRTTSTRRP